MRLTSGSRPAADAPSTTTRFGRRDTALIVLIALVALLTFPGDFNPMAGGLDPSWMWGVNAFAAAGLRWGRDLVFSYGPLGFIARPLDVGHNVLYATILRLCVHGVILGTVVLVFSRRRDPLPVLAFLAGFLVTVAWNLEFDYQLAGAMALTACAALDLGAAPLLIVSAVLAGSLIFVKFATGLVALLTMAIAAFRWCQRHGRIGVAAWALASSAAVVVALSWLLFGSLPVLSGFLRQSMELSRGYNDSMSIAGPSAVTVAAGILLGVTVAVAALSARAPAGADVFLVFAALIPFSAKHAFLRADWEHMPFFFGLLWWAGTTAILLPGGRRRIGPPIVLLLATTGLFVATAPSSITRAYTDRLASILTGRFATDRIARVINPGDTRNLREASRAYLGLRDLVPTEWKRVVGSRTVMVVPWELSVCPANGLVCVPYPTLQMYATLTEELDQWSADRLRSSPADFVIVEVGSIDGRNMIWDAPETWQALMEGWEVSRAVEQGTGKLGRLLLRRRARTLRLRTTSFATETASVGEWVEVPRSAHRLRAAIDLDISIFGRLRGTLLRSRAIRLDYKTESGRQGTARLVIGTAKAGVLLDARPDDAAQLGALFEDAETADPIRAFRIAGDGAADLRSTFSIGWLRVDSAFEDRQFMN
jgi:hypothetical protein